MHSVINSINSKMIWVALDHCWLLTNFLVNKYKNAILLSPKFHLDIKISFFLIFMVENTADGYRSLKMHINYGCQRFCYKKFAITFDTIQSQCGNVLFQQQKMARKLQEKGGACFSSRRWSGWTCSTLLRKPEGSYLRHTWKTLKPFRWSSFWNYWNFVSLGISFQLEIAQYLRVTNFYKKSKLPDHRWMSMTQTSLYTFVDRMESRWHQSYKNSAKENKKTISLVDHHSIPLIHCIAFVCSL